MERHAMSIIRIGHSQTGNTRYALVLKGKAILCGRLLKK